MRDEALKTLLVEDNPGDQELMQLILEDLTEPSYEITSASRLSEARELAGQHGFDLIILDLGLPDSSGLATLHALVEAKREAAIVVLTGNSDEQVGLAAVKAGAQDFLTKGQISNQLLSRVLQYAVERKRAEIEVRNSEIQLRTILDALDNQVLLIGTDHRIIWPNERACSNAGRRREEIIGKYCYELWPRQHGSCEGCPVDRAFATGTFQYENRRIKADKVWDIKACPVKNQQEEIVAAVELRTDVSEQVQMEEQFRQAQKMEAVGRLAGGIAHDFNNMLSVILGFAEIARRETEDNESLADCLDEIMGAGLKSTDLVRQLLAFSRRQPVSPQLLDINANLNNSQKILKRLIGEDISLEFSTAPELPSILIDPSQFDQIIANLTVNARDAIPGVGVIGVTTAAEQVSEYSHPSLPYIEPGDYVTLEVTDNGCGMNRETQDKIFEPFFTTKKHGEGTGLGMSTIYGIIKQNSGYISVESEPEAGTSVKIFLPVYTGEPLSQPEQKTLTSLRGSETILVVEDETPILRLCKSILSTYGYTVFTETSPEKALEFATDASRKIDLLITDVIMPNMNGKQLREKMVKLQPTMKSLYISGYTADILAHQGVKAEGIDFLQKPFSKQQLAYRVREVLEHS